MIRLCDYGCGQEAKHQFKNGKWCCSKSQNSCPNIKSKFSQAHSGENHHFYGKQRSLKTKKKISKSKLGSVASKTTRRKHSDRLKKLWNDDNSPFRTKEYLDKLRISTKNQWKDDVIRMIMIKNISISTKKDLEYWETTYPLFYKIEEMRYNPDKPGEKEIQVHCKNHNCEHSKEQGGWFTPTYIQLYERIRGIEKTGNDGSYFYCSDDCKNQCPLYHSKGGDPFITDNIYVQNEYNVWKQTVLEQDNYTCQICGSNENLHCHHIIPVKIDPMLCLDPDNGIVLCEDCHYRYGHKTGTECSTGNLSNKICNSNKVVKND